MFTESMIGAMAEYLLFSVCVFILLGSIYISFKTKFIQIRFIPALIKMLRASIASRKNPESQYTIPPHRALFTAMSTTLGIGTIVGPVIAINLGGPGALLGFLLTSFFGSAATYTEVNLCIKFRQKLENGEILGGPMQYLKHIFSPGVAKWYAICCCVLMTAWSAAQANQLAAILDSPLLGAYRIPTAFSGICLAGLVIATLIGGIKRVSAFSSKLVPLMFVLYIGSSAWILFSNLDKLWGIFGLILESVWHPYEMATGSLVGGIVSTMRWGVFKGTQANESGVGTQTIPHSMAETNDPIAQGMLAMLSTYTAGMIAFVSGCVALVTETWQDPQLPMGISMVAASYHQYFSSFGIAIVAVSSLLFAFGTILGNSYNGTQCFGYLIDKSKIYYYYLATAVIIFIGTISGAKLVWSVIDIIMACMVLPHMAALMVYAYKQSDELLGDKTTTQSLELAKSPLNPV